MTTTQPTTGLDGALCVGRWWLFESTDWDEHLEAAAECAKCPALEACHALLLEVQESISPAMRASGGGCSGTWAGVLVGKTIRRAECGTDSGYFRHRRYDEDICGDCREAHSRDEAARYSRRRARKAG